MADDLSFPPALADGYRAFLDDRFVREQDRYASLAEGQSPEILIISCCDSRVSPEVIFDARPGELFVVRNVANLVPPFETGGGLHGVSAALEFAVTVLKVDEILVLGHGACGGVKAALSGDLKDAAPGEGGFVASWIKLLDDARAKVIAEHGKTPEGQTALEQEGVRTSLKNLMTFPFVKERVEAGTLELHGAVFAIADGKLRVLQDSGAFEAA